MNSKLNKIKKMHQCSAKVFLHLVRNFTWLVDHVLSVVVGQLDARLDDGPAEPGRLDFAGLLHDPLH